MSILDRQLQREILSTLAGAYPNRVGIHTTFRLDSTNTQAFVANTHYLVDHSFVEVDQIRKIGAPVTVSPTMKITARGMDFLEEDGGLSAILGIVTVKLHEDTLKRLIQTKIEEAPISEPEKHRLRDAVKVLPAQAMEHVVMKLLDFGLTSGPEAFHKLSVALGLANG